MKKILPTIFFLFFFSFSFSQDENLSGEEMSELKEQVTQLVDFLEYSMNTIGDSSTPSSQKEIIIYESYSKIFANDKVQVEDDLDDKREVVINKDVQAYLKDIDFFFRNVHFEFNIESIEPQFKENNQLFFLIRLNRKISGTTVKGDTLKNNLLRFIEVNYDKLDNDLKIASFYSTQLNEDEEFMHWWNNLSKAWRNKLASDVRIFDTLFLTDILAFNDSAILINKFYAVRHIDTMLIVNDSIVPLYGPVSDTSAKKDTVPFHTDILINKIKSITKRSEINIEGNYHITKLEPLVRFRDLEKLNCSNTTIHDLTPIRNLSKLEFLDCSESGVRDISVLRYSDNLRDLRLNNTAVSDLSVLIGFDKLEILHAENAQVEDISALINSKKLKDLRINGTKVTSLDPLHKLKEISILDCSETQIFTLKALEDLHSLQRLFCSGNDIKNLEYLSGLEKLQTLVIDNTYVSDLSPLSGLPKLEKIYCDNSRVTSRIANEFMAKNPDVLVIYESSTLQSWWEEIGIDWQLKFSEYFEDDLIPTKEQLHQILNITKIDISHNGRISVLDPLSKLSKLESIDISFTMIENLDALDDHVNLRYLDAENSKIKSVAPLKDLINLQYLNLANTLVSDLNPLLDLPRLQEINLDNTKVSSLTPLKNNANIKKILCDNTGVTLDNVMELYTYLPECLIIYQTDDLKKWWKVMPIYWKNVFRDIAGFQETPDKFELHIITNITELSIQGNKSINTLSPIYPLQRLQKLNISSTSISDISPLNILRKLVHLDMSNNPVSDISAITGNKSLVYLDIKNNPLEDLSYISYLTKLESLNCSGIEIKDLDFASGLKELRQFSFYNTEVKKLKEIEELTKLKKIECYNTRISSRRIEKFSEKHPDCEIVYY